MQRRSRFPSPSFETLLLVAVTLVAIGWVLTFPRSDECYVDLIRLRGRTLFGALLPFDDYPYWRPVWHFYLKICDELGLGGGLAHLGVVAAHVGAVVLIFRLLQHAGLTSWQALLPALAAAIAPGTATALSWLAAGNKAFTLFFLALGVTLVVRARTWRGLVGALLLAGVPALGSSENGYMLVLLLPAAAWFGHSRWRHAGLLLVGGLVLAKLHSLQLHGDPTSGILEQLRERPLSYCGEVAGSLGRFFIHGLGLGDDWPLVGALSLVTLGVFAALGTARKRRLSWLGAAFVVFLILNWPASFLPGLGSSRHQAYLPAVGAGLIWGVLLMRCVVTWRLSLVGPWLVGLSLVWFLWQGWSGQGLWAHYLERVDQVLKTSERALPRLPASGGVFMLNVPVEYRALFVFRFGEQAGVKTWTNWCVPRTRSQVLLPEDLKLPTDGSEIVIEYDGRGLRRTSIAELARLERAPPAWFVDRLAPFPDQVLPWGAILASDRRLTELNWSLDPLPEAGGSGGKRNVRVLSQGEPPKGHGIWQWEVEGETEGPCWLVLGWTPIALPLTERVTLFVLTPLPWAFRAEVEDRSGTGGEWIVRPVLGALPAVLLRGGSFHLQVRLHRRW